MLISPWLKFFFEQIKLVKSYKKIVYHTKEYHPHPEILALTLNTLTCYIPTLILNTLTLALNTLTLIQSVGSSISLFEVHITFGFESEVSALFFLLFVQDDQ